MEQMMHIFWGDSLERLAGELFARERKQGVFAREAVIVGSPLSADWLKQFYLYDLNPRPKQILANWDFLQLHPFVNDWLEKAVHGTPIGERTPALHPYSGDVLHWRLWEILAAPSCHDKYPFLHAYCAQTPLRRLDLAAALARLFDDYQNYRPDILVQWQQPECYRDLDDDNRWQADLWRDLVSRNPMTYLQAFLDCHHDPHKLTASGIRERYARIAIFNLTTFPKPYLDFFRQLAKTLPVELYLFNPSREFWMDDPGFKQFFNFSCRTGAPPPLQECPHPLLSAFGRGIQALLATILDEDNVSADCFNDNAVPAHSTLLHALQHSLRARSPELPPLLAQAEAPADASLQIHVCHNAQREIEVVKDLLLHWFAQHPGAQPRDVQVLLADFATFAPLVEATFNIGDQAPALPARLLHQPPASAGAIGAAFLKLVSLPESRMTAPEVFDILAIEPIATHYNLSAKNLDSLRKLIADAYIRWGRDREHVAALLDLDELTAATFPETLTWQRGFDRLLCGLCYGPTANEPLGCIDAGNLGPLHITDSVEGERVTILNIFITFYDDLLLTLQECRQPRTVPDWCAIYADILNRFFTTTESSHQELLVIRQTLQSIHAAAQTATNISPDQTAAEPVAIAPAVMAAHLEKQCQSINRHNHGMANAVLFTPLQATLVTPRKLLVLMGLSEGVFPRADTRSPFDLLERQPRFGDRSLRREDRLAFLEALLCARDRLIITYTGCSDTHDDRFPPAPVVSELIDFLEPHLHPITHLLNPHDPRYFSQANPNLISYSEDHYHEALSRRAATAEAQPNAPKTTAQPRPPADDRETDTQPTPPSVFTLARLQNFFVNPAKDFLTRVLNVYLPDGDCQLSDCEIFIPDGLESYQLNEHIFTELIANRKPNLVRLQESGLLPLGPLGQKQLTANQKNIQKEVFEKNKVLLGKTPYAVVLASAPAPCRCQCTLTVAGTQVILTGDLCIADHRQLFFRCCSLSEKDRVKAWIAHLFAAACFPENSTQTFVGGLNELRAMDPINHDAAKKILQDLLTSWLTANRACLPFAPSSSWTFMNTLKNDPTAVEKALTAVRNAWNDSRDNKDRYLHKVWGEAGPSEHPDFAALSCRFWGLPLTPPPPSGAE